MRNLSTEFKEKQHNGKSDYLRFATLNLKDGTTLNFTNQELWSEGFSFDDSTSSTDSFSIGAAIVNSFTLTINNINDEFTDKNFEGATVSCSVGFDLANGNESNSRIEKVAVCTGTVVEAPYQDSSIITLKCEDNMRKFDKDYSESQITYPATRLQIVKDACDVCGVNLQTTSFDRDDYVVQEKPSNDNLTFRQVISWVLQLGGQYGRCDASGRLCVDWYDVNFSQKDISYYNFRAEPNLLKGTENFSKGIVSGELDSEKFNKLSILRCNAPSSGTSYVDVCKWDDFDNPEPNTDYALSFYAKASKSGMTIQSLFGTNCVVFEDENGEYQLSSDGKVETTLTTQWVRYSVLWLTSNQTTGLKTLTPVRIPYSTSNAGGTVYIAGVKFERNTENTEYIPNPEDFNACALLDLTSITPNLEPVVITGVRVTEFVDSATTITNEDGTTTEIVAGKYLYGKEGYVLEISENRMIPIGTGETVAAIIGEKIVGMSFTPFTGSCMTNLELEAGDSVVFTDRKGKTYKSYLTNATMQPGSTHSISNNAKSAERNSSVQYSLITRIYQDARNAVIKEKTAREKALEDLSKRLEDSDGVFTTVQETESGAKIYYLHNKPSLDDSDMIWKMTAEAWAVSTDGGKTWNAGMTVDGDVIARILTATGVNAEWINTGALTVKDGSGKTVFSVDMDTGSVIIDAQYIQIGGGNLTDKVNNLQGQIDGNIQTWTGTSAPTLENYPANEWETDEEKDKHVGDVYYDGNNHAYRFRNDGSGYEWQQLKDTDITKALQDSSDALQNSKDALNAAALAKNMTMQLDNDYQAIPVDDKGQYSVFPDVTTSPTVMYGSSDITDDCTYDIVKSGNIQGNWNLSKKTYTVTALTADSGWVDIKATYLNKLSVVKRLTVAKLYAGAMGEDGKGISGTPEITYQVSSSGDAIPSGTWQTTIPSVPEGQYLWTRTVTNYTDGTSTTAYSVGRMGENGEQGIPGANGKTSYFHIKYSSVSSPTSSSQMKETPDVYIGTYVDFTETDSTDPKKYTWSRFQGAQGEKGDQGIPGVGEDGKTSYLHIAYATSADGKTGFSVSDSTNKTYIGQYTDFTEKDSTDPTKYSWSKIKGDDGAAGRTYFIEPSVNVLKRSRDDSIVPNSITFSAYYRDGTSTSRTAYSGRFIIEETSDGSSWKTIYTSSSNESSITHSVYAVLADGSGKGVSTSSGNAIGITRDVSAIRCKLYAAGGTSQLIDMQSVAVVVDIDNLSQTEVFNILTNNGAAKGIYMSGNELYVNATYLVTGMLADKRKNNYWDLDAGKFVTKMAKIGDWVVNDTAIYKDVVSGDTTYRVYFQPPLASNPSGTFVLSCQKKTGSGPFSSAFILFSNGKAQFGSTTLNPDGSCTLGTKCKIEKTGAFSLGYLKIDNNGSLKYGDDNIRFSGAGGSGATTLQVKDGHKPVTLGDGFITVQNNSNGNITKIEPVGITTKNLNATGTKKRIVDTKNYATRSLYCYEMPSPVFGDIGEAILDEKGKCIIMIDDIFSETIVTNIEYQVFLQKEGQGDAWIEKKEDTYFEVAGTPGLKFAWEIKARQKDYETERLEIFDEEDFTDIDYASEAAEMVNNFYKELEVFE